MNPKGRDEHNPDLADFTMNELIRELSARTNGWSAEAKLGPEGMLIGALREWIGDKSPSFGNHPIAAFAHSYGRATDYLSKQYGGSGKLPSAVDVAIKEAF